MVEAAPKISLTGFHAAEVRKPAIPNFAIAGNDSLMSTARMPMMKIMTVKDARAVSDENRKSI